MFTKAMVNKTLIISAFGFDSLQSVHPSQIVRCLEVSLNSVQKNTPGQITHRLSHHVAKVFPTPLKLVS